MYKVLYPFTDKEDKHVYHVGDVFPVGKRKISEDRIAELSGNGNALGKPLICKTEIKAKKKEGEA